MIKQLITRVEREMDEVNGKFGYENALCLFCGSEKYNGKDGVAHKDNCILLEVRQFIEHEGGKK